MQRRSRLLAGSATATLVIAALAGQTLAASAATTGLGAGDCASAPDYEVTVISPAPVSTISTSAVNIVVCAPGMKNVWARSWHQPDSTNSAPEGYDRRFANATPDADGKATVSFPADQYPKGPIAILIDAWDSVDGDPNYQHTDTAYLQAVNAAGVSWAQGAGSHAKPAAAGSKSLVYQEDFTGPLSSSRTGAGATYASAKPDGPNGTEFGEAVFGSQGGTYDPFRIIDNQYLSIRSEKLPAGETDPQGWNRQYYGGLLSSARTDGTGFAATYGYFEARMLAPAAKGAWPAFWLMSQDQLPKTQEVPVTEIDVVELYGHNPAGSCQTHHLWASDPQIHEGTCDDGVPSTFAYGNSASTWHTYGVNVTPTDTIYYVDGTEVFRHATDAKGSTPLYFMVDLALGGGWPVDLTKNGGTIDLYVDYIRVYA